MKASYILALIAAFAASSISATVVDSKLQNQEANGNNAVVSTSDYSVVGAPGVAQKGVNVLTSEANVIDSEQAQQQ
ncbi:hypothetical protein BJV82DRAFT_610669 [Fennellomyces sp. T-0311]|nr:hypothetical protein BJV82DRAFT_610669 [Fennellomyces sp. T-0311]